MGETATEPKPRLRCYQFRLWHLFVLMTLICLVLGWAFRDRYVTHFEATTKSQHARFFTEPWTGVAGDPVQTELGGRPVRVDGLGVLLLHDGKQLIRKQLGPQPSDCKGAERFVEARLHLERTRVGISVPGGGTRTVYSAVIEELISCEWYTGR